MFLIKKAFQEILIKMKPKILVTRKLSDGAEEKLKKNFDVTLNLKDEPITNNDLVKMANEYDGFISTGFDKIGEDFFKDLNGKLKIIAQVGVGYDNISVKSAESKKIKVTNTPNVLNEAVAETTILLILAASRRIGEAYNLVRSGEWKNQKPDLTKFMIGNSVTGKTLGIIGMGRIGRMAANCAKAFGMKIIYYNRNKLSEELEDGAKYFSDINSLMPECDFVSIHTPATAETKHILNVNTIGLLPKHAVVINTSRGSTIDDDALIDALQNNKIYAAGLDVFNNEPNLDERYMKLDNCFVLPHVGSATHETRLAMSMMAVDNICNYFKNKPLISEVV
jgi:glyoxylate reductase